MIEKRDRRSRTFDIHPGPPRKKRRTGGSFSCKSKHEKRTKRGPIRSFFYSTGTRRRSIQAMNPGTRAAFFSPRAIYVRTRAFKLFTRTIKRSPRAGNVSIGTMNDETRAMGFPPPYDQ